MTKEMADTRMRARAAVPICCVNRVLGNRIVPAAAPGMAPANPFQTQPRTFDSAPGLERFQGVFRTGRCVAASAQWAEQQ